MTSQKKRIIECPFCQTKFYVWLSLLTERRKVKCSSCGNAWFQDPYETEKPLEETTPQEDLKSNPPPLPVEPSKSKVAEEELKPIRFISNETEKKKDMEPVPEFAKDHSFEEEEGQGKGKTKKRLYVGLILLFLLVFVGGRNYIVKMVPDMGIIYRSLGISLDAGRQGFELRNTSWYEMVDKGIPSIVVNGELTNMSNQVRTSPAIQITLRGSGGCHPMDLASYIFGDDKAVGKDGLCVVDQWSVNASYDRLLPGQVVSFSSTHPYDERSKVEEVQIGFTQ